jgi:hypothetical protein
MKIVGSLTTTPSRINNIIPVLESIVAQDELEIIYLTIPWTFKKTQQEYIVPENLYMYDKCSIIRGQDYGSITKITGALLSEHDPETLIVTFDDDVIYPKYLLRFMLEKRFRYPDSAIGSSGFQIGQFPAYGGIIMNQEANNNMWYNPYVPDSGLNVDILAGYAGVMYKRGYFPPVEKIQEFLDYPLTHSLLYINDDVFISSWLSSQGIPRMVFKLPQVTLRPAAHRDGLSEHTLAFCWNFIKAIRVCQNLGLLKNSVPIVWYSTITAIPLLLIFFIFFFIYLRKIYNHYTD